MSRAKKGKRTFRELEDWIGKGWVLGFQVPVFVGKGAPEIWAIRDDERGQLASVTVDWLESLPGEWYDRILKILSTGLPSVALLSTVAMVTFPRLMMQARLNAVIKAQGAAGSGVDNEVV